jgi:hypothetical protein
MRGQLQKVGPHAFPGRSLAAPSHATPRVTANNLNPGPRRAAPNNKVANGGILGEGEAAEASFSGQPSALFGRRVTFG